jgi:hypothetical protein
LDIIFEEEIVLDIIFEEEVVLDRIFEEEIVLVYLASANQRFKKKM